MNTIYHGDIVHFSYGSLRALFSITTTQKKTFPGIKANQNKHNIKPNLDEMQEWDSDCEQVKSRKKDIEWALYLSLLQHTQNELKQNQEITGSTYPLLYWFSFFTISVSYKFYSSLPRSVLFCLNEKFCVLFELLNNFFSSKTTNKIPLNFVWMQTVQLNYSDELTIHFI